MNDSILATEVEHAQQNVNKITDCGRLIRGLRDLFKIYEKSLSIGVNLEPSCGISTWSQTTGGTSGAGKSATPKNVCGSSGITWMLKESRSSAVQDFPTLADTSVDMMMVVNNVFRKRCELLRSAYLVI